MVSINFRQVGASGKVLRLYTKEDFPFVQEWHCERGIHGLTEEDCSPYGYVCPGVAAGFLYSTDSKWALLDGFITNPKAPIRDRYRAVTAIAEALLVTCRFRRKIPLAFTQMNGIRKVANRLGLKSAGLFDALTLGE